MTDLAARPSDTDVEDVEATRSTKGLTIFEAPPLKRPPTAEQLADVDLSGAADGFDYSDLLAEHDEADVRDAIADMARAIAPGSVVTPLFFEKKMDGMSLVHAWFGPGFPLFRHSHPKYGDCLYYVVAGEAHLGNRVLKAGDGFFVPNGAPYRYTAGPDGVEVLEFRSGGGDPDQAGMKLLEKSPEAIRGLASRARELQESWEAPERINGLEERTRA